MPVEIKRVYEPASSNDGYRVLVARLWPLRRRARGARLTLVYSAHDTEHNDAVVLAEILSRGLPKPR